LIADRNPKLGQSWFLEASRQYAPGVVLFEVQDEGCLEEVVDFLILHFGLPRPLGTKVCLNLKRKGGGRSHGDQALELEAKLGRALGDVRRFSV